MQRLRLVNDEKALAISGLLASANLERLRQPEETRCQHLHRVHQFFTREKPTPAQLLAILISEVPKDVTGNPAAATPLGVLMIRKLIKPREKRAGDIYRSLHVRVFGHCAPRSEMGAIVAGLMIGVSTLQDAGDPEAELALTAAKDYLVRHAGVSIAALVDDVCLYDRPPTAREIFRLGFGLDALHDHFEDERKRAAAR